VLVEIRNLDNGRRTLARVNDRGPFVENRIVDCSLAAAKALGFVGHGVARVQLRLLDTNADVASILARKARPLVEDAAPPVLTVHAVADRLALVGPPAPHFVTSNTSAPREATRDDLVLRRASVLPFPVLLRAWQWLANTIVGPDGHDGTDRQVRKLLGATGVRGFVHLFTR
jgi:hypothetical protein